jgi:hypothetical protein
LLAVHFTSPEKRQIEQHKTLYLGVETPFLCCSVPVVQFFFLRSTVVELPEILYILAKYGSALALVLKNSENYSQFLRNIKKYFWRLGMVILAPQADERVNGVQIKLKKIG